MRWLLLICLCCLGLYSVAQVPDTTRRAKSKRLSLSKYPRPEAPEKKRSFVVVTSGEDSSGTGSWENEWTNYIEEQARVIAEKVLHRDSTRTTYKVMLEFSIQEDGSLRNLNVSCYPPNTFIVAECSKLVVNGPKKRSAEAGSRYVRMSVKQPIDIKVK